ncbi:MAG: ankyrin repeat domain-containing protein [Vulcanimicrobiota bacterium]
MNSLENKDAGHSDRIQRGVEEENKNFHLTRCEWRISVALFCCKCGMKNHAKAQFCSRCGKSLNPGGSLLLENRYRILRPVKTGGMGVVYKAEDTRLGTAVALKKMLPPEDSLYSEQRFREEAKLLSKLHHSGLPKVTDFFIEKDPFTGDVTYYLVMTFIEGEDLQKLLDERLGVPFPVDEVERCFLQILNILNYLHSQNPPVIYRDLKPSNIMVNRGAVYLVDFGIAREFDASRSKTIIGTNGYMAPEQWRGSAEPRSDLYALGALMHYLLTGKDPAEPHHPSFRFEAPCSLNPSVPRYLDRIIMLLLEYGPDMRPSSACEVLQLLKAQRQPSESASHTGGEPDDHRKGVKSESQTPPAQQTPPAPRSPRAPQAHSMPQASGKTGGAAPAEIFNAIEERDYRAIVELVRREDGIHSCDERGRTPLHKAAFAGLIEVVEILIQQGVMVDKRDRDNNTALHLVSQEGHASTAALLIQAGADVNARVVNGWTPLHLASSNGHIAIVKLLLESRADVEARNLNGKTALFWAIHKGHSVIATMLRRAGAPE